ncbi:MAG: phosphatidylinositol mannoside acyltransferase [Actinobacteria bacterium]|nr:phosphatidylinositol mannoside acyltransferase [Actinomycetota bacterium]
MSTPERFRGELAFHVYRMMAGVSRSVPGRAGRVTFDVAGRAAHALMPGLRATVAANQARVLGLPPDDPVVRASTREAFRLYARYWAETFRFSLLTDEETLARTPVTGYEHVEQAFAQGRGVICVLPHLGNWDVGGRYMAARGHSVVSVAEELRPQRLFELFLEHRQALGLEILGLSGDGRVGRRLARRLHENRMVALVADRDLGGRGMEVEMFGRPRRLPTGPALLSLTTGAPILVTPTYQIAGGWRIVFGAPLTIEPTGERGADVATLTRLMGAEFERAISAAPADWHLFQPGWDP